MTNLLETFEQWTQILDDGGCIDVIYMDFMKAFDKVPYLRVLVKLQSYYKRRSLYLCSAKAPLLDGSGNRRVYPLKGTSLDRVYVCL